MVTLEPIVDVSALAGLADGLAAAALTLARRFAAGATMWAATPRWSSHGDHVAVEFVHPVIVGKRALPAVHVDDADLVGTLRLLARPGDILLALGGSADPDLARLVRRSEPWGLTSLWIGSGERPVAGAAHHLLWLDHIGAGPAGHSGGFVLLYHLLWELTHVVFEHPGLLESPAVDERCTDEVCLTCSDEGRLAEVATVLEDNQAVVRAGGRLEVIDATLVEPLAPGDLVVVHAGGAIARLEEKDEEAAAG